jgi:RND family efflux transporter MFP subunit
MKKKSKIIILSICLISVAVITYKFITNGTGMDSKRQNVTLVKTESPFHETVSYELKFTGDILPIQQANIVSKVSGTLEKIYADIGTYTRQEQMLALIDTTELYQLYQQYSATYQNTLRNFNRTKELAQQNLVSKQELDNAEAAMTVAKANSDGAKTRLDYAHIKAPFSGFITKRFLDAGALINSNATLFTLMDLSTIKIMVNILEKDISLVKTGSKATATVDALPGKEFTGTIKRISEALDLSTRTMAVEIDIPNTDRLLKPGMFATVKLIYDEHKDALTLPTQALMKDDSSTFVMTVNSKIAKRKNIVTGKEIGSRTEILSGLNGSENIITTGQQFVKENGPVTIQK